MKVWKTQVCVVGGGAAGLTVARSLGERGIPVVVLERGARRATAIAQREADIEASGLPLGPGAAVRRFALGGSGRIWGKTLVELSPADLAPAPWRPNASWPFGPDELAPWYEQARLQLSAEPGGVEADPQLSPELALVAGWRSPRHFPFPEAMPAAVTTVIDRRAVRLITEGDAVRRVEAIDPYSGRMLAVEAETVVLAAGAIETAVLLLHSGIGGDQVGCWFAEHPQLLVPTGLRASQLAASLPAGLMHPPGGAWALRDGGSPGAAAYLVPHRDPALWSRPRVVATGDLIHALIHRDRPAHPLRALGHAVAGLPDLFRVARSRSGDPQMALRVMIETRPDPANRVTLAARTDRLGIPVARVHWQVGDESRRSLGRLVAAVTRLAHRDGWGPPTPPADLGWPGLITPGAHHMGTTRMSDDPRRGVVDAHGRVHGISNLFVAGPSVFPTYGWANPMLTTVALALRLGEHIRLHTP